ncbi:hypothetical protein G647_09418 [Cladophialophora carrionii CBS 160.54]|uniref:Uncharacterized protein n=1 Tax=Cladophialophora carrionii CBS 160.54 TaxID=1279043 RepID=V9CY73_9EURO|nr:uncharacterized protein G647_09418 [Cladophialophora carrionii CBS 160.54]ETI19584.1 hypothetical protein G647_09418 [Cladophialophora carrionii CBS 160.54]
MKPLNPSNTLHRTRPGQPSFAINEDCPTQEDDLLDGETANTKQTPSYLKEYEKTSQAPRGVVSSRPLQPISMEDDFLSPDKLLSHSVSNLFSKPDGLNEPPPLESPAVTKEAGSSYHDLADHPASNSSPETRRFEEVNITSGQLLTADAKNKVENTDGHTLTLQHNSAGFGARPADRQQESGKLISQEQGQVTQRAGNVAAEDCNADNQHAFPYFARRGTRPADQDDQPGPADSTHARQPELPEQWSIAGNVDDVGHGTSPSVTANARTHPINHSRTTAGTAPIHDARVSKVARRRQPRPGENLQAHGQNNAGAAKDGPCEEDLLFLLMSKTRESKEARTRSERLELENRNLRHEMLQSGTELRQAVDARNECIEGYDLLNQHLENFKERYSKLKQWAMETNKDCEELQGKASNFENAISGLPKDRDELLAQLQNTGAASIKAAEQLASVRNAIGEVRIMAKERSASINDMDGRSRSHEENLSAERRRCDRLEQHIVHLELERDKQNVRMYGEQQELRHALKGLSDSLQILRDGSMEDSLEKGRMLEALGHIVSLLDTAVCKRSDLLSLKDTIETAKTSFAMVEKSISEDLQATVAHLTNSLQIDVAAHSDKLLSAIPPHTGQLNEVASALVRLEQKAEQMELIIKLLQDAKTSAEKESSCLQGMADNLEKALFSEREAAQKTVSDLTTNVNEWTLKCQEVRAELEKCKQEREAEASVVPDLQNELAQKKTELELAFAASQRDAQDKDKLAAEKAALLNRLKELAKKNAVIPALERSQQQSHSKITELESTLKASRAHAQKNERLAKEKAAVESQLTELRKENSALTEVRMNLQQTTSKVDELQNINTSLEENLASLKSDLDEKNKKCSQIGPLKDSIKAKDDELAELRKQLASSKKWTSEVERPRDDRERTEGELAAIQQQIRNLEGALSNAKLDLRAKQAEAQSQGGHRSATTRLLPDSQLGRSRLDLSRDGVTRPLALSAGTATVSETQSGVPESVPVGAGGRLLFADRQVQDGDWALNSLPDAYEDDALEADIQPRLACTELHNRGQGHPLVVERVRRAADGQGSLVRVPSSSYSSQGEQMLLDQVGQVDAGAADNVATGTAPNGADVWRYLSPEQAAGLERLRNIVRGRWPPVTPKRSIEDVLNRPFQPTFGREQHRSNPAVKRRLEPEVEKNEVQENTRRLKRGTANLEITMPQPRHPIRVVPPLDAPTSNAPISNAHTLNVPMLNVSTLNVSTLNAPTLNAPRSTAPTFTTLPAEPTVSRGLGRYANRNTIVGTYAPAPGKIFGSQKPPRKGSRADKFHRRFNGLE